MAIMKREPGFMGLAKARAKKKPMSPEQMKYLQELGQRNMADQQQEVGMQDKMAAYNKLQQEKESMIEAPKVYDTGEGGDPHYLTYLTEEEIADVAKRAGHKGKPTPYDILAFPPTATHGSGTSKSQRKSKTSPGTDSRGRQRGSRESSSSRNARQDRREARYQAMSDAQYGIPGQGGSGPDGRRRMSSRGRRMQGGPPQRQGTSGYDERFARNEAYQRQNDGQGGGGYGGYQAPQLTPEQIEAQRKAAAKEKWESDRKSATEKHESGRLGREREGHIKGIMKDAEGRTMEDRGVMTDASGKKEGEEGFDFESATLKGGYDESTAKRDISDSYEGYKQKYKELGTDIGGYRGKFDTMAGEARAAGDKGATAMGEIGEGYKGITGDAIAAEAKKGQAGFEAGAEQAGGLQAGTQAIQGRQAGYEGQLAGMADKVASGEAGQSQAAMLQGQMEEQRMAGQKGSEEKLRREMAQSGASPAEIASKVAQFQRQSAGQQAQASRSEATASQLQGQQLGQQQMGAAAGLMGQALGATGQQLGAQAQLQSQGAQQAALRGQAAGMGMAGAQAQQQAQLASLQGQGQAVTQAAGLSGQGIQQQAGMMGQGIGALQAQGGMVGQQAGMTTAQLQDVVAQQTQQYQESEAEKQRKANAAAQSGGGGGSGGLLGALGISDIRLKENIELLEKGKDGDPNIYSFSYKFQPNHRWSGVMAQELLGTKHSDSVRINSEGYYMVDYHKLGIQMKLLS